MQENQKDTGRRKHSVNLENRSDFSVTGVSDVPEFDENSVEIVTDFGIMVVEGQQLKIAVLDTVGGNVRLTGSISAIFYRDDTPKKKKRFFG